MIRLLLLANVLVCVPSFAQNFVVDIPDQFKVLYRGYENKASIAHGDTINREFEIKPVNCKVQRSKHDQNEGNYTIRTKSSEKTAKILFVSNGSVLDSAEFLIRNLPVPCLFWGDQKAETVSSNSKTLEVRYPNSELLKADFIIDSWKFVHGKQVFSGKGNMLSEDVKTYLKTIEKGDNVTIVADVLREGGIVGRISGRWFIQ